MKIINRLFISIALAMISGLFIPASAAPYPFTKIGTSGSSKYSGIAQAINSWVTTLDDATNMARVNRSLIIDQVEATLRAAGKNEITDAEYDTLADALCFWLRQVTKEGDRDSAAKQGWYIYGIAINDYFFRGQQCVWELVSAPSDPTTSDIWIGINDPRLLKTYGYGPRLYEDSRLVLFTDLQEARIYRGEGVNNDIMFSTNGENSGLLILGRKEHRIIIDGGYKCGTVYSDPTKYQDVLNRKIENRTGVAVGLNGGSILTAYTTFTNNDASSAKSRYKILYNTAVTTKAAVPDSALVTFAAGGSVAVGCRYVSAGEVEEHPAAGYYPEFNIDIMSFYKTDFKNNSAEGMGGAVGVHTSYLKSGVKDGYYFRGCNFIGNQTRSHGGALTVYIDYKGGQFSMWDTKFLRNCQTAEIEAHGGGIFYRSSGEETCKLTDCEFTENYAHGTTVGGGGVSNQGKMNLVNCKFYGNMAENSFGGGIATNTIVANDSGVMEINSTFKNCIFDGNQCTWTGDLGDVSEALAYTQPFDCERGSGGAIHLDIRREKNQSDDMIYKVALDIQDNCIFNNNHADRNGGAIAVVTTGNMQSWLDSDPQRASQIISNMNVQSGSFSNNTAGQTTTEWTESGKHDFGGAVYLSHTNLNIGQEGINSQISITGNSAKKGGAIAVTDANLNMYSGNIGAMSKPNTAETGGGVYLEGGNANIKNGNIQYNTSNTNGGGIYVSDGDFVAEGGKISANSVVGGNGGGIYVNGGNTRVVGGEISANSVLSSDDIGGNGGGFYSNGGQVNINNNSSVRGNTAVCGAGAYIDGGVVTIGSSSNVNDKSAISGNIASQDGGGLYVNGGDLTIDYGEILNNNAQLGGGIFSAGGTVIYNTGKLSDNTAYRGGGLFLGSGAEMTFNGGIISGNKAVLKEGSTLETVSNTAYHGVPQTGKTSIEGFGGGIYLKSGSEGDLTKLNIAKNLTQFGLYSNTAETGGAEIVAEGSYTFVDLPDVSKMYLSGFEGAEANPYWYQDYAKEDEGYGDKSFSGDTDRHAVTTPVNHVDRYETILANYLGEYVQHNISAERLPGIATNHYLCLMLGFSMADIIIEANGLLGNETARAVLIRHGSDSDTRYDVILQKPDSGQSVARKVLKSMPWGTYSIIPDNNWSWGYNPLPSKLNFRIGGSAEYTHTFEMEHKSTSLQPHHDEVHNN